MMIGFYSLRVPPPSLACSPTKEEGGEMCKATWFGRYSFFLPSTYLKGFYEIYSIFLDLFFFHFAWQVKEKRTKNGSILPTQANRHHPRFHFECVCVCGL